MKLLPLLLILLVPLCGCFPDDRPRVSIEFGAIPEFEGAEVLIDDHVVGKLERTGQATRISFPVEMGDHTVCIKVKGFRCEPAKVTVEMKGQKVRLLANVLDMTSPDGQPVIGFQGM